MDKIRITWSPKDCNVIPTIPGQTKDLGDGSVEAWYTRAQAQRAFELAARVAEEKLLEPPK